MKAAARERQLHSKSRLKPGRTSGSQYDFLDGSALPDFRYGDLVLACNVNSEVKPYPVGI